MGSGLSYNIASLGVERIRLRFRNSLECGANSVEYALVATFLLAASLYLAPVGKHLRGSVDEAANEIAGDNQVALAEFIPTPAKKPLFVAVHASGGGTEAIERREIRPPRGAFQ